MSIYRLFHRSAFEPDDVEAMAEVFEMACVMLKVQKDENVLREIVAALVIECARTGERDPQRQCEFVLSNFGHAVGAPDLLHAPRR
jgi:hypothetical protein